MRPPSPRWTCSPEHAARKKRVLPLQVWNIKGDMCIKHVLATYTIFQSGAVKHETLGFCPTGYIGILSLQAKLPCLFHIKSQSIWVWCINFVTRWAFLIFFQGLTLSLRCRQSRCPATHPLPAKLGESKDLCKTCPPKTLILNPCKTSRPQNHNPKSL